MHLFLYEHQSPLKTHNILQPPYITPVKYLEGNKDDINTSNKRRLSSKHALSPKPKKRKRPII